MNMNRDVFCPFEHMYAACWCAMYIILIVISSVFRTALHGKYTKRLSVYYIFVQCVHFIHIRACILQLYQHAVLWLRTVNN